MWTDSHCHLDDPRIVGGPASALERGGLAGVTRLITVGTDAAAYNASKAALAKITQVIQREAHEYEWPARIHGLMPSAMNTPMMEQWNLRDDVMMDPDTVASAIEFMITLPPDTFVQNLVINSRREPGWPR